MRTTGLPSGQAEHPSTWVESMLSLLQRFSASIIVRLKVAPACFSSLISRMFLLSLIDVLIEVMLLYVGPPDVGPILGLVEPQAPPVVSFLWLGLLLPSAPLILIVRSELIQRLYRTAAVRPDQTKV